MLQIPFNKPYISSKSVTHIDKVFKSRKFSGDGPYTQEATRFVSNLHDNSPTLMTTSCTHALELCSLLIDLAIGDEVIIPSYTFTSAAIAVSNFGATPVFVDVDSRTRNIDTTKVVEAITPATKAISFVNYAGQLADVLELRRIADAHNLFLIEDNAHGFGIKSKLGTLGTFGDFSTYSFHETKNFQCGEGGALVINNNNFVERAEILREKGTDRSKFFRGAVDKYQWVDKGSSYLPSELLMAVLLGQFEEFETIQNARIGIWNRYDNELRTWAHKQEFETMYVDLDRGQAAHMYYLIAPDLNQRQRLIEHLSSSGVSSVFHYKDLGGSIGGKKLGRTSSATESSKLLSDRLLRLPLWYEMSDDECSYVIEAVKAFSTT